MANLNQISDDQRRAVLRAFNSVIASIRDSATLADLTALIEQGNINAVIDMLQLDRATFAPLEQAIADAYRIGGETAMGQIGRIPVDGMSMRLVFDVRSSAAEAWLDTSSKRIVEIVAEQRAVVRSTLQSGMASGLNPRSTALDIIGRIDTVTGNRIGGVIGLTEQQAGWVSNARQELLELDSNYFSRALRDKRFDSTVRRAIADGKPLTQAQIDKAITQMQNRAQRYRGETIARTESLNALRAGHHDAVAQAIEAGDVDAQDVQREWSSSGGGRTRDAHIEAGGQKVGANQPFIVNGERLMYPGDPAGSPGNVINCFTPHTTIAVSSLRTAIRREYTGNVINIRAGTGINLTVTPNHPILTSRGWVAADKIVKGDKLVDCGAARGYAGPQPDIANGVTTAEQLYDSAQSLGSLSRAGRCVVDLHGEIPAEDVDVISMDGRLWSAFDSPAAQFCDNFSLSETDISLVDLVYRRIELARNIASSGAHGGDVRGPSPASSFVWRCKGGAKRIPFADIWRNQTQVGEAFVNGSSTSPDSFGYSVYRISGIKKALNLWHKLRSFLFMLFRDRFCNEFVRVGSVFNPHFVETQLNRGVRYPDGFSDLSNREVSEFGDQAVNLFSGLSPMRDLSTSLVNPFGDEPGSDHVLSEPGCFGDRFDRLPRQVEGFDFVDVDFIQFDHYSGPVFNFETGSGLIVSGNTITHNCRCSEITRIDFAGKARRVEGFG